METNSTPATTEDRSLLNKRLQGRTVEQLAGNPADATPETDPFTPRNRRMAGIRNAVSRAASAEYTPTELTKMRVEATQRATVAHDGMKTTKPGSTAFTRHEKNLIRAHEALDTINEIYTPQPPEIHSTVRDLVKVHEGLQEPLDDHEEQEQLIADYFTTRPRNEQMERDLREASKIDGDDVLQDMRDKQEPVPREIQDLPESDNLI